MYVWQSKKWPDVTWSDSALLAPVSRARLAQGRFLNRVQALGFDLGREAEAAAVAEETVKTSAIEGEKLSPESVRSSVARHLGLSIAGLPPVERSVDGLVEVLLDATKRHEKPLLIKRIKSWHAALFPGGHSGLTKVSAGKWREYDPMRVVSGREGREKVHFEAPPSKKVAKEMRAFLVWWKSSRGKVDGLVRAGMAHFHFVTVHPFEDGNGRLARALTDMALAQDEESGARFYSMSSQIMSERKDYYDVLEKTQKGNGDITEWLVWFVACFERAIHRAEGLIAHTLAKAGFWQKYGSLPLNDRQRKVVSRLLDAGPGGFEGGLTTRKYVSLAKASRATAYREILDLVEHGLLVAGRGKGRSVSYELAWD